MWFGGIKGMRVLDAVVGLKVEGERSIDANQRRQEQTEWQYGLGYRDLLLD
jgi:hypothetical protein